MHIALWLFIAFVSGVFGFTAGAGLTGSLLAAIPIAILFVALTCLTLWKFSIIDLERSAYTRGLQFLSVFGIVAAVVQLLRLTVFMIEPSQEQYSTVPWSKWEIQHSCLSAYHVADTSTGHVPDIYSNQLYSMPDDDPKAIRKPRMIGSFRIDVYEYPPPFLLLPRAVSFFAPDFLRLRMLWFALNGIVVLIGMLLVAHALGPIVGTRALLLIPLVWAALPTLGTLQKGNVQMIIIALSMIAMLLFAKRKFASGGTVLAYVTASKLYPAMLLVYLLMRRQWRAFIFTAAAGIILAIIALYVTGWQSYLAFMKHLPGLLSGESFPAFRNPFAMAINFSIPGIVFKLKLFGLAGMDFNAVKIVGWIYNLILIVIIVAVARRNNKTGEESPIQWMAILILATLRSPFLPQGYAAFPPLWLLTLLVASHIPTRKTLVLFFLAWVSLNINIPVDSGMDPRLAAVIGFIPQSIMIAIALLALRPTRHLLWKSSIE